MARWSTACWETPTVWSPRLAGWRILGNGRSRASPEKRWWGAAWSSGSSPARSRRTKVRSFLWESLTEIVEPCSLIHRTVCLANLIFFIVNPYPNNLFTPPPLSPVDGPWVHKLHEWMDECCESFDPLYSAGVPVSVCTWTQTHCSTLWPIMDCTHLFIGPETSRHFPSLFSSCTRRSEHRFLFSFSVFFHSVFVFISSSGPTLSLASLHNCCLLDLLNSSPWSFRILSNIFWGGQKFLFVLSWTYLVSLPVNFCHLLVSKSFYSSLYFSPLLSLLPVWFFCSMADIKMSCSKKNLMTFMVFFTARRADVWCAEGVLEESLDSSFFFFLVPTLQLLSHTSQLWFLFHAIGLLLSGS